MKIVLVGLFVLAFFSCPSAAQSDSINIIPKPRSAATGSGGFTVNSETKIVARDKASKRNAAILSAYLQSHYGAKLKTVSKPESANAIVFTGANTGTGEYDLAVEKDLIRISGAENGQFYAIQTLMQLAPVGGSTFSVPSINISDAPRFAYRGMHLDVARHFEPVEFVKKFIDLMSQYKFNYFHWHLTDDQGWRIPIKKYPKLTEIGSTRPETVKERNLTPYIGDGIPHGGFYTREQIKDVIAYAKERHITVVPEIELPGHASAALAAYPQYGCKPDYKFKVQTTWGIFKEVYCPTDETFKFLEDVLEETIKLFPDSPYVHIGGDEVLKDHWKESTFVQALKQKENLKDEHEVQSYFVRRIEKFINSKGKKIIGWDEILEGGVAPNATIMSWRGMKGGIEAAKAKHEVIMTPNDYVYFDYGQGDPAYEPLNIGSYVPLSKVYSFDPVPKELTADEAKYIIGGQANIWTEYIKTPQQVEYMAFPRMLALAESLWSRPEDKNFDDFTARLRAHLPRLDVQNVNYRIPEPGGLKNVLTQDEKAVIELKPAPGTRVHYTIDGKVPDITSPIYEKPIEIALKEREVVTLKTIVVNSAVRKSSVYAATIVRDRFRDPAMPAQTTAGLNYELFIPRGDGSGEGERKSGETKTLNLNQFTNQGLDLKQPFAVTFDGYFGVKADGLYEIQVDSTWDATVVLAGEMIIDDTGTKDRKVKSAIIPLKAGVHKISIRYNHRGGDAGFRFRSGLKGQGLTQGGEFSH
ncbi:MAG TPA: family 20 glycosylhydrolase [Pyrinomonadaceae bacterium]|nr:family 20 glycosylhydrolase [Pyrinomonadaceae bacterium]